MALSRGFKSSGSMNTVIAFLLTVVSLLFLVSCDDIPTTTQEGSVMMTNDSSSCSGKDKEMADRYLIAISNWGYNLGAGKPNDPNELSRLQQEATQIKPACRQYVESIGARLQDMRASGSVRGEIDKLPW